MLWWFALTLVGSFVVAQLLLVWLQQLRGRRIEQKSRQLCQSSEAGGGAHGVSPQTIPITIITGFLGSGKTTLVNNILTGDHGRRILVIENELGAISIDHELIDEARQQEAPSGVIVLKNGCMCCSGETPGSELERVLDQLLKIGKVDARTSETSSSEGAGDSPAKASLPFDYVLIETSGLADPGPVMQVLWRQEMARSPFYLDGVVTVVDAAHILRHLRPSGPLAFTRRRPEAEKQVAVADRLVINKVDLVESTPDELTAVSEMLSELNAAAPQLRTSGAKVSLEEILYLSAYSSDKSFKLTRHHAKPADGENESGAHGSSSVSCISIQTDRPVYLARLQTWLRELALAKHDDLYRIKGVLSLHGESRKFITHGIHAQVLGFYGSLWGEHEQRSSSLVLIGHQLEEGPLKRAFLRCCSDDGEAATAKGLEIDPTGLCTTCEDDDTLVEDGKIDAIWSTASAMKDGGTRCEHGIRARKPVA